MKLELNVVAFDGGPLPPGSLLKVEIRDTSLADAPAVLLKQLGVVVPKVGQALAMPVTIDLAAVPDGTTVWVHVDVDRDGRVSKGDYVSVESYPVKNLPIQSSTIRVKKVT